MPDTIPEHLASWTEDFTGVVISRSANATDGSVAQQSPGLGGGSDGSPQGADAGDASGGTTQATTSGQDTSGQDTSGQNTSGQDTSGQDSSSQDTSGRDTSGRDTSGQDTSGQDTSGQDTSGQDTSGQDTSGQDTSGQDTSGQEFVSANDPAFRSAVETSVQAYLTANFGDIPPPAFMPDEPSGRSCAQEWRDLQSEKLNLDAAERAYETAERVFKAELLTEIVGTVFSTVVLMAVEQIGPAVQAAAAGLAAYGKSMADFRKATNDLAAEVSRFNLKVDTLNQCVSRGAAGVDTMKVPVFTFYFETNSADFAKEKGGDSQLVEMHLWWGKIEPQAQEMIENGSLLVQVIGMASDTGTPTTNEKRAVERAAKVKQLLADGMMGSQANIRAKSISNSAAQLGNRLEDRRVDIMVTQTY